MDSQISPHSVLSDLTSNNDIRKIENDLFVGILDQDDEIDGMELSLAADRLGVSVDEVWRRIKNGLLLARTHKGQVFVYTDLQSSQLTSELPPVPKTEEFHSLKSERSAQNSYKTEEPVGLTSRVSSSEIHSLIPVHSHSPELALLIDHLSLAKEENREILRLTHDSMARLTHMTDSLIDMKNSIIASKEEQMAILKQKIAEQSAQLIEVLKEKEDLETLTQALQNHTP